MSSSVSMRHIALFLSLTLALAVFAASPGHSGATVGTTSSSVGMFAPGGGEGGDCGTDGDPDNPTVDSPRTSRNGASGDYLQIRVPEDEKIGRAHV